MFFITLRGVNGKEVFLTDLLGLSLVENAFKEGKDISFQAYKPSNLEEQYLVLRRINAVSGMEVHPENSLEKLS